jgi:hypothetical protein
MNVQHGPTEVTASRERHSSARVPRRWIVLARGVWITLVVLTLVIFFGSLPMFVAQLQTPCTETACEYQQLTHSQAETLKGMGLSLGDYVAVTVALILTSVVVCLVVSTLIIWRRPDDRMALVVAFMLVTLGPLLVAVNVPPSILSPWSVPNACLGELAQALLVLVFLLFPDGRFVPRWTRWTLIVFLAAQIPLTFFPAAPLIANSPESQLGWFVAVGELTIVAFVQLYRYRRVSSPRERQQTKWVVFGIAVLITVSVLITGLALLFPGLAERSSLSLLILNESGSLLLLLIPLSFGFAMLRYRLWDIDAIINRTLVYATLTGVLTGILALVYLGSIFLLQDLFRGMIHQENEVAIVISTLVIYALFRPVQRPLQAIIDRRFYRRKYDAAKTLAAFSATLRQEVDLDQLREQLLAVVQETMQPAHISLWLRPPAHDGTHRAPWRANPPVPSEEG